MEKITLSKRFKYHVGQKILILKPEQDLIEYKNKTGIITERLKKGQYDYDIDIITGKEPYPSCEFKEEEIVPETMLTAALYSDGRFLVKFNR